MQREIPGYYYDAEKRKYFKVERTQTAPAAAAYSTDAVKRRKIEDRATEAERRRAHLVRNHVKRHALQRDLAASGLLAREVGERGIDHGDVAAAAWAGGLAGMGEVPFAPSFARLRTANMPCFYVGGEDRKTGLGVAYATLDEETLIGSYIPTDENGRIHFSRDAPVTSGRALSFRNEMIRCPQMSSIRYHEPSHKIMLTSREPDHSCGLYFFSPPISSDDDDRPHWLLGETNHYQRLSIRHRLRDQWLVHRSTPAPASSDLLCVIGTNAGILRVRANETMSWIADQNPPKGSHTPQEIFDLDFQHGNPNVLLAGGRKPRVWVTDLRCAETEWTSLRHTSSVAHIRSVNEHGVLVAGLQNSMALYDLRFTSGRSQRRPLPLLEFSGYKNEAHFHTGWDVNLETGVIAGAQDDGTVKLFSLRSGRALRGPAALGRASSRTPIKALMFQTMPRDRMPSLFVGEGCALRKYSFVTEEFEDEA